MYLYLTVGCFVALVFGAACEDIRRHIIPNWIPLTLALLWIAYAYETWQSIDSMLMTVGTAIVVFAVGALLFARKYFGGGDVKLITVAALWVGYDNVCWLLILTGLLGGVLAIVYIAIDHLRRTHIPHVLTESGTTTKQASVDSLPYCVAIALAGIIVVLGI